MSAASRSYGQKCGLAAALDLLGERWTLLVVRELARGPKRFKDLFENLEGIGTNLLSRRLKTLEAADVIKQVTLTYPVEVPAYDLGPRGQALRPILEDLALWGFDLLDRNLEGVRVRASWTAMTMEANMHRADSTPPDGLYAFEVDNESFWLRVNEGDSTLRDGSPPFLPDACLTTDLPGFIGIAAGGRLLPDPETSVAGDQRRLKVLLQSFCLPEAASSLR
jgi:DNA-binding HxlR family transcriptional regulator